MTTNEVLKLSITKKEKIMRRISFLMVAFLMTVGVAMAQSPDRGKKQMDDKARSEKRTEQMAKEYGLNDAQKARLLELNTSMSEQMKGKRQERQEMTKEIKEQKMAEMKKHQEAYQAAVKEIFTAEQFQKFQTNQAEHQKKMQEKRGEKKDFKKSKK